VLHAPPVEPPRQRAPKSDRKPPVQSAGRRSREETTGPQTRAPAHLAPLDRLGEAAVAIARDAESAVFEQKKRAERVLSVALSNARGLGPSDQRFIKEAVLAMFRWRGWIAPLRLRAFEARLLLAVQLDSPSMHPVCRLWAKALGRDPARLVALGDAPTWAARAEGLRRLLEGQPINTDPWRLFPDWLHDQLPLPPGDGPPKVRLAEFLRKLQARPALWVRAQGAEPSSIWEELGSQGIKPWCHRRINAAAKLDRDVDVYHLPALLRGALVVEDLAAQAVGLVCDPDPGERWWVTCAGGGGKALHLSALMRGKGVVVASERDERRLKEISRRARRGPHRNLTTKTWDGRHVAGKTGRFDGVLVEPPSSAIGTWRRHPDARWTLPPDAVSHFAALQSQLLHAAAAGVREGGALIYSVSTVTPSETLNIVRAFLETHSTFRLDPFPNPLIDGTTDGTLLIWPQAADSEAVFVARMIRGG
jgi:16S rRNA (cytosine967-C5)-methyltransferase